MYKETNQPIDEQAVSKYYAELFKDIPIEQFAKKHKVSEVTIKNLISGKTPNPGVLTLAGITYPAHGSLDAIFNKNSEALKESAINAIKDMYEFHSSEREKLEEKHITNTRAHYEQHVVDLKENYEMRLSDKREIIKEKDKRITFLTILNCVGFGILIGILILEVMHPNLGWIRF